MTSRKPKIGFLDQAVKLGSWNPYPGYMDPSILEPKDMQEMPRQDIPSSPKRDLIGPKNTANNIGDFVAFLGVLMYFLVF